MKASTTEDGNCEVNRNAVNVPGFVSLNQILSKHVEVPEIYHLVISLLLRHPVAGKNAVSCTGACINTFLTSQNLNDRGYFPDICVENIAFCWRIEIAEGFTIRKIRVSTSAEPN